MPGTLDLTEAVQKEDITVVKNMPSFSPQFRGFDFKLTFKPLMTNAKAKVSAVCDNMAAAIGCAAKSPEYSNGLVVILGTAPAVATFNRKRGNGLETAIWQNWVWFTKIELKDPYGYWFLNF